MATRRGKSSGKPSALYDHSHMFRVFGLEVLGSVILLTMVMISGGSAFRMARWAGASWYPVVFVLAVLSSLAIFLMSFINLIEIKRNIAVWTMSASLVALFSITALTFGNSNYLLIGIAAFILTFGGSELAHNYSRQKRVSHHETIEIMPLGLEVLASIAFIIVAFASVSGSYPHASIGSSIVGPILFSFGLACSVALFLLSFGGAALSKEYAWTAVIGGLCLVAVTFGSLSFFVVTLIGFILAILGSAFALFKR